MQEPAIGFLEMGSIARGIVACDAMAKAAPVNVVKAHPVCPGKFIILVSGEVAPVREAMKAGVYYAGHSLVDRMIIENLHKQVIPAICAATDVDMIEAVGIIETFSLASTIVASDAACKAAEIRLIEIRLGTGLGGKGYVTFTGDLYSVEAAIKGGIDAIESGLLLRYEIIPSPHSDLSGKLV